MILYAILINRRFSGDDEMIYLWRNKTAAKRSAEYRIGKCFEPSRRVKIIPMEVRRLKSDDPWKKGG